MIWFILVSIIYGVFGILCFLITIPGLGYNNSLAAILHFIIMLLFGPLIMLLAIALPITISNKIANKLDNFLHIKASAESK